MTNIAKWQIDGLSETPFHFTIMSEMREMILKETQWVDQGNHSDVEYWKRFRVKVNDCIQQNTPVWDQSPDEEKNNLWQAKYESLKTLYAAIHNLHVKYSLEPYQSDVYREKIDQSIDYITDLSEDGVVNINDYPFIKIDSEIFNISPKQAAMNILSKRSDWISKMVELERIRLQFKNQILNAQIISSVQRHTTDAINTLSSLDQQWI